MSDYEFIEPEESDFLEEFGAERIAIPDTIASFVVDIEADKQSRVELSYDVIARSARVRWIRESETLVDIFREQVTGVFVEKGGIIRIPARGVDLAGELIVEIYPVRIRDTLLA